MPDRLTEIPAFLFERQRRLAAELERFAPPADRPPSDVHRSIRYTLLGPSKRVRGVLTLLAADLFGPRCDPMPAAVAIECVHASSLILDDLPSMDDTPTRRGRPATHVEFGEATAILAAVALLNLAFGRVASAYDPPLASALARVLHEAIGSDGLIGGQAADLQLPAHPLQLAEIEPVDERKTAVLFRAAATAGAMIGGADKERAELLGTFGERIGLAFQIVDDILDTAAPADAPRHHAASIADTGAARRRADELVQSAVASLSARIPQSEHLRDLARFFVERSE